MPGGGELQQRPGGRVVAVGAREAQLEAPHQTHALEHVGPHPLRGPCPAGVVLRRAEPLSLYQRKLHGGRADPATQPLEHDGEHLVGRQRVDRRVHDLPDAREQARIIAIRQALRPRGRCPLHSVATLTGREGRQQAAISDGTAEG